MYLPAPVPMEAGTNIASIRDVPEGSQISARPAQAALIALGLYLSYLTLSPFVVAFTWAGIFAILFRDAQVSLARRMGSNWAAFVITLAVFVLIVTPGAILISALAREGPQTAKYVEESSAIAPGKFLSIWSTVRAKSPFPMPQDPTDLLIAAGERVREWAMAHAGAFLTGSLASLGILGATLLALFFMLRGGDALHRHIRDLLPFSDHQSEQLMSDTSDLVVASIRAGIAVAVVQGVVAGVAFWLLGLGPPTIWGVLIGLASLLPLTGSAVVWVPVALWLIVGGEILHGVMVLLVGTFGLTLPANLIRPAILSGKTTMNPGVLFFGLLGGAAAFGLVGLIVGPIILVMTSQLIKILLRSDSQPGARNSEQGAAA
jgi:predicted PurR-regulated permease PerM